MNGLTENIFQPKTHKNFRLAPRSSTAISHRVTYLQQVVSWRTKYGLRLVVSIGLWIVDTDLLRNLDAKTHREKSISATGRIEPVVRFNYCNKWKHCWGLRDKVKCWFRKTRAVIWDCATRRRWKHTHLTKREKNRHNKQTFSRRNKWQRNERWQASLTPVTSNLQSALGLR